MNIKATAAIFRCTSGYWVSIFIDHPLLIKHIDLCTVIEPRKGELRRKVIQLCSALNLDLEWI